jgi:hypothetical protein
MPGIENELEIERNKTIARWFGIVCLTGLLYWQRGQFDAANRVSLEWVVGAVILINLFHTVYLFNVQTCPAVYKYISVGLDALLLTITIRYTGFSRSPFFFMYFLLLISNCIRYGLLMSLYIAALVNVFYAVVLSLGPDLEPTVLGGEGLKILAFWGVALYGGSVAARIRRQAFEIEAYEDTIAALRLELEKAKGRVDV